MKPIYKILLAVILAILICQTVFLIARKGLTKYNNHKTDRLTELFINKTKYDIIFIGSSRTHTTIDPGIIDSVCQINSYNAGVEGGNLYEFKLTLDAYLVNHPAPRYLVLTLDLASFNLNRKIYNFTQYLPYIQNKVISCYLQENGHNTVYFQLIPFIELTAYDDYTRANIIKGLAGTTEIQRGEKQYKGYLTNTIRKIEEDSKNPSNPSVLDTKQGDITESSLQLLQAIIDTCQTKNTKIIFTYAPEYRFKIQNAFSNKSSIFQIITNVAKANNIPYLRHDNLEMCYNPNLFANPGHVNRYGATLYSNILGQELNHFIHYK